MKIAYMSDLHQEINGGFHAGRDLGHGDVLLLAGDITCTRFFADGRNDADARSRQKSLRSLLTEALNAYRLVVWIPGNHEYYGSVFKTAKPTMDAWLEKEGLDTYVKFMEAGSHLVDGVLFVCATLWTNFDNGKPLTMEVCRNYMHDYCQIYAKDYREMTYVDWHGMENHCYITPQFILQKHLDQLSVLKNALIKDLPTVVMTHHSPSFKSTWPRFASHEANGAYCSSLEDIILDNPQIKFWVHGHTHYNVDYPIGDCRVLSNQLGYVGYGNQPYRAIKDYEIRTFELP